MRKAPETTEISETLPVELHGQEVVSERPKLERIPMEKLCGDVPCGGGFGSKEKA